MRSIFLSISSLLIVSTTQSYGAIVFDPEPATGQWTAIPNGGFETGEIWKYGWEIQVPPDNRGQGLFVASTEVVWSGTFAAKAEPLKDFSGPGFAHITPPTAVCVKPGEEYILSAFFHTGGINSGNLYLDFDAWTQSPNLQVLSEIGVAGWQFVWGSFVPTTDIVRVRIVRDGEVPFGEFGYIDDVGVTLASDFIPPSAATSNAVPEPPAIVVWLLGIGIVCGFTGKRWHRKNTVYQVR